MGEIIEKNYEFINKYSAKEWIDILRDIVRAQKLFGTDRHRLNELADNMQNIVVKYSKLGLEEIQMESDCPDYDNVQVILTPVYIKISRQTGDTFFKERSIIPIEVLRLFIGHV